MSNLTPDRVDVKVLQSMIDTIVGLPGFSYPARQNNSGFDQTKPVGEFAHIRLLEEYPIGIPNNQIYSSTDEEIVYKIYSPAKLRFRVGIVDTTGLPSSRIMHGWTSEAIKTIMLKTGYGFVSCKPISNEDAKLEKEWEYRKGFSIEMYVTRTYMETTNTITKMSVGINYIDKNLDEYLSTITIN